MAEGRSPAPPPSRSGHPEVFAHKSVGQIADHTDAAVRGLSVKPAVIGHSFGGLLTQIIAGRGLSAASVAIDPAPFRGGLPLPFSVLKASAPVLDNPASRNLNPRGPSGWREVADTALAFVKRFV